ncbi:MAG: hypothetical protein H6Q27_156 [Ignavibacteriaceae bacterium]|nr:hypothetical protein [Ignavibacteriaceae bacterium]
MALMFIFSKIVPSIILFISLLVLTVLIDYLLHLSGFVWVGRYLGIVGTLIIISSFIYSLRKRKIIKISTPKQLLQNHELFGWSGALMILVHGGIHFNAIIPWLALFAMVIVVASGLTGKYLLKEANKSLKDKQIELKSINLSPNEIEKELFYSSLLVDTMQKWRKVHMPLTMIFAALALLHIIITLLLWSW